MSLRLTLTRASVGLLMRAVGTVSNEKAKNSIVPYPQASITRRHEVHEERIADVRCVWIDKVNSSHGIVVYLHGGSYVTGPIKLQWTWLAALAKRTGMAAVAVDYSLAPEYAYPIAHDETVRVMETILGSAPGPVFLTGDSAGGGLALGVALGLRDKGGLCPDALVLSSPWLDVTMSNSMIADTEKGDPILSVSALDQSAKPYAGDADPHDPFISPLFGDPTGLPPMLVHVGTREIFLWENREWAERCLVAGVSCLLVEVPGGFHTVASVPWLPEGKDAVSDQALFLAQQSRRRLSDI